jgi:ethanolamine ammonia-lyase small subunit
MNEMKKSQPASEPKGSQPTSTSARLSLGRSGPSIPTHEQLSFQLDHALARDAVHAQLDTNLLVRGLQERNLEPIMLQSAAPDRRTYLSRPDLGRTLNADSTELLQRRSAQPLNVIFILADGLSALAVERHALPLLDATLPLLTSSPSLIPIISQARVAIGDQIGQLLFACLTVLLIGERPGLSSPDSLGVYITWDPRPGRSDAERNCISNIRAEGLSYAAAAARISFYINEAQRLQATGIALKDPALPLLLTDKW